jgi:hypothetical protein
MLSEIAIKRGPDRNDFRVVAPVLRRGLLDNDYNELPISSHPAVATQGFAPNQKDPLAAAVGAVDQHVGL